MNSRNHEAWKQKAIRLEDDWECFLKEHPDILVEKKDGKIVNIIFPPGSEYNTLVLLSGKVYSLHYVLNDVSIDYKSPEACDSLLYELLYNLDS